MTQVFTATADERIILTQIFRFITFRVSRRRREMYFGHARLCVCLSVCLSAAACLHYCTADPSITWGIGRGCPLVVHYWADLQSVHGMCCYGNITRMRNVSEYMLVLAVCLVWILEDISHSKFSTQGPTNSDQSVLERCLMTS